MSRPILIKDKKIIVVHVEATLHDRLRESAKIIAGGNLSALARMIFDKHVEKK